MSTPVVDPPVPLRFCLDCRTALGPGDPCDAFRGHRVVDLRSNEGRAEIVAEVWGLDARPIPEPRETGIGSPMRIAASTAGLAATLLALHAPVWSVLSCVGVGTIWLSSRVRASHARGSLWKHAKGVALPASVPTRDVRRGTAHGPTRVRAPGTERACLAYALVLADRGKATLYYEAHSVGFDVHSSDGLRIHVPRGRVRLAGPSSEVRRFELEHARRLGIPARVRARGRDWPVFPFTRVREIVIREGDRVAVGGVPFEGAMQSDGYRTSTSIPPVAVRGVPRLVLEDDPPA